MTAREVLDGIRGVLPPGFWERVDKTADCWLWTGTLKLDGYGTFWDPNLRQGLRAHRLSYQAHVGPIPEGLVIDHLCRVRNCVNPRHLEAVTNRVNTLRGVGPTAVQAEKTHCDRGHPLSGANLYMDGAWRRCIACRQENSRRYRASGEWKPCAQCGTRVSPGNMSRHIKRKHGDQA